MRATHSMLAMMLCAAAACGTSYEVHTMAAPDVRLTDLRAFRILPTPPPSDGRARTGAYDPMVNNSITNRALREAISTSLRARGYQESELAPDFLVAVYASAHEDFEPTVWDYGYPYWPWPRTRIARQTITQYTEGTVVIDVLATNRELLWRGSGSARLSEDPAKDTKELQRVAEAIVARFPAAVLRALASQHSGSGTASSFIGRPR